MLPEEHSADFEISQAIARIRNEYQKPLASAEPKAAEKLMRDMNAKIRRERLKIKIKHFFFVGKIIR